MLSRGGANGPPTEREIMGVACDYESRPAAREAGQARRGPHDARRNLQLVHRRVRASGSERGRGAARGAKRLIQAGDHALFEMRLRQSRRDEVLRPMYDAAGAGLFTLPLRESTRI